VIGGGSGGMSVMGRLSDSRACRVNYGWLSQLQVTLRVPGFAYSGARNSERPAFATTPERRHPPSPGSRRGRAREPNFVLQHDGWIPGYAVTTDNASVIRA
jgi:hypothetical protein